MDVALPVVGHTLGAVPADRNETQAFEQPAERFGVLRRVLDELEAARSHRVFPELRTLDIMRLCGKRHGGSPRQNGRPPPSAARETDS